METVRELAKKLGVRYSAILEYLVSESVPANAFAGQVVVSHENAIRIRSRFSHPGSDLIALRCPYCGSEVAIDGFATINGDIDAQIVCQGDDCHAAWSRHGGPDHGPEKS